MGKISGSGDECLSAEADLPVGVAGRHNGGHGIERRLAGEPSGEPKHADPDIDPEEASSMLYIMDEIVRD